MATEATSKDTARQILNAVFAPGSKDRLAGIRDDYATILAFLSDKQEFERGLVELSKELWDLYSRKNEDAKNKFSTSLIQYAVLLGFPAQTVTILAAGDDDYLTYLKNGTLIKDEMDLLHGEYSHSLQWLAAGSANLGLTKTVGQLYMALGDEVRSTVDVWRYIKKTRSSDLGKVSLWAYLVDSFPMSMVGNQTQHANNYSLFTDNYRCPQNVMSYLLNLQAPNHFLARYFQWRYLKRSFMTKATGMQTQVQVATGATIKNWADQRYANNPNYTKLTSGAGFVRSGPPVAPDPPGQRPVPSATPANMTQVTFHGKAAWVHGAWDHI